MLDVSFTELALIVVIAFLVLGPKELPNVIRALSKFMRQCREVIDECRAQLDGLADEAGVKDLKDSVKGEAKFIKDQYGEWRETYDISDIMAERRAKEEAPKSEEGEPKP